MPADDLSDSMESKSINIINRTWSGVTGEYLEPGTYYVRGLVALVYILNDKVLITKIDKCIN